MTEVSIFVNVVFFVFLQGHRGCIYLIQKYSKDSNM